MKKKIGIDKKPEIYIGIEDNVSEISLVEIPNPILKSKSSYVHNLSFFDKQRAMKSSSFSCFLNSFFALEIKDLYSFKGIKVILFRIKENNLSNLSSESFDLDNISSLFFINSSLSLRGANIFNLVLNNSFNISPLEINVLKNIFESITTCKDFIYTNSCSFNCLCIDNLTLSDNSSASCSVNLLLETISSAIDSSKLLTNSLTTLVNANSNSFLNSGSISTLIQTSSILTDNRGDLDYLSFSIGKTKKQILASNKLLRSEEESLRGVRMRCLSKQKGSYAELNKSQNSS